MIIALTLSMMGATPIADAPTAQAEGIAVMDLNAIHGVPQTLADLLNERLTSEVQASKRFQSVIAGSDLRAIFDLEKQMQALGCEESNCLTQIGGALGVPYLMVPSVGMAGGKYMLILKVLDVEEGKVLARLARNYANESSLVAELAAVAQGAVKQVFGEAHGLPKVPPVVEEAVQVGRKPVYARASLYLGVATIAVGAALPFLPPTAADVRAKHDRYLAATDPDDVTRLGDEVEADNSSLVARQGIGVGAAVLGLGVLVWAIAFGG